MKNINNDKDKIGSNPHAEERLKKLQVIIESFEDTSLKYGPISSEELKNRINKVIRDFDKELTKKLEIRFEMFWNNNADTNRISFSKEEKKSNTDIPRFLKNYKK